MAPSSEPRPSPEPALSPEPAPLSEPDKPETHSVKYLWVLRHAKATPHGRGGGGDYDRPLTARGRRDALALGNRLAAGVGVFGLDGVALPQIVLTSSATRTAETAALVIEGMAKPLPVESYRSLYQSGTETILQYVREIDDDLISAMVVGHNPTIYRLAWELLAPDCTAGRDRRGRDRRGRAGAVEGARLRHVLPGRPGSADRIVVGSGRGDRLIGWGVQSAVLIGGAPYLGWSWRRALVLSRRDGAPISRATSRLAPAPPGAPATPWGRLREASSGLTSVLQPVGEDRCIRRPSALGLRAHRSLWAGRYLVACSLADIGCSSG